MNAKGVMRSLKNDLALIQKSKDEMHDLVTSNSQKDLEQVFDWDIFIDDMDYVSQLQMDVQDLKSRMTEHIRNLSKSYEDCMEKRVLWEGIEGFEGLHWFRKIKLWHQGDHIIRELEIYLVKEWSEEPMKGLEWQRHRLWKLRSRIDNFNN